jgi:hypothetical protein
MHQSARDVSAATREPEKGGLYVLADDGPVETWRYQFVTTIDH